MLIPLKRMVEHRHLYTPDYYATLQQGFDNRSPRVLRRIGRIAEYLHLSPEDVILETGCGPGTTASALASFCRRVVAADYMPLAVELARQRNLPSNVDLLCADLAHLPYPGGTFEKIIFSEVVEHLEEPAIVLRELFRVLKPGGLMAVTTWPSRACISWWLRYRQGQGSEQDFNPQSPGSLKRLLRQAGFEILQMQLNGFYFRVPLLGREFYGDPDGTPRQRFLESLLRGPWAPLFAASIKIQAMRPINSGGRR